MPNFSISLGRTCRHDYILRWCYLLRLIALIALFVCVCVCFLRQTKLVIHLRMYFCELRNATFDHIKCQNVWLTRALRSNRLEFMTNTHLADSYRNNFVRLWHVLFLCFRIRCIFASNEWRFALTVSHIPIYFARAATYGIVICEMKRYGISHNCI